MPENDDTTMWNTDLSEPIPAALVRRFLDASGIDQLEAALIFLMVVSVLVGSATKL